MSETPEDKLEHPNFYSLTYKHSPMTGQKLAIFRKRGGEKGFDNRDLAAKLLLAHDFWRDEAKAAQRDYCRLAAARSTSSARDVARDLSWDDLDWETHGE